MVCVYIKYLDDGTFNVVENDNGFITVLKHFRNLRKAMAFAAKQYQA